MPPPAPRSGRGTGPAPGEPSARFPGQGPRDRAWPASAGSAAGEPGAGDNRGSAPALAHPLPLLQPSSLTPLQNERDEEIGRAEQHFPEKFRAEQALDG